MALTTRSSAATAISRDLHDASDSSDSDIEAFSTPSRAGLKRKAVSKRNRANKHARAASTEPADSSLSQSSELASSTPAISAPAPPCDTTFNIVTVTRSSDDLWLIFEHWDRKKGIKPHCSLCKAVIERDGRDKHPKLIWEYAMDSSNTTLRNHINKYHKADYIHMARRT